MDSEKRVLLARPHAFIVGEMRPFLLDAGYTPVRLEDLENLAQELSRPLHGAIISTAVTSTINADAATVFKLLRERAPRLPVVFAGMANFETLKAVSERVVKPLMATALVTGTQTYRAGAADRSTSFLVLRKEDLLPGTARDVALRALRAHFA